MNTKEIERLIADAETSNDAAFVLMHELNIKVEPFEEEFSYAWLIVGDHGQHTIEHKVYGNDLLSTRKAIANVAFDYLAYMSK